MPSSGTSLPSLAFREKNNLFEKILPALRRAKLPGQQLYLELDVARWFLSHREIASASYQTIYGPALDGFVRALQHAEKLRYSQIDSLYEEASHCLSMPLLNSNALQTLQNGISKNKERSVTELTLIRNLFCFTSEDRKKLIPLYKVALPLFANTPSSPYTPPIMDGVISDRGANPTPYIKRDPDGFYQAYMLWKEYFPEGESFSSSFLQALLFLKGNKELARCDWGWAKLTNGARGCSKYLLREMLQGSDPAIYRSKNFSCRLQQH